MTTIAYRDGILAADTQATRGDEPMFGAQKLFRTEKYLVGIAGRYTCTKPFLDWIERTELEDILPDEFYKYQVPEGIGEDVEALLVSRAGRVWNLYSSGYGCEITKDFDAIGSGSAYAIGAMAMGASAAKAVEVAMAFDVFTGGEISAVSFVEQHNLRPVRA